MPDSIPDFDHNAVLPPHKGDPRARSDLSPYPCTTEDLVKKFATSPERIEILNGFLDFREELEANGLVNGFQWLDGSFMEDIESQEGRPPNDLDLVTVYWGYDHAFQADLFTKLPAFGSPHAAKATYKLDHYPVDAGHSPESTVENIRYWMQLFTHNRNAVWKGMLKIDLGTPSDDSRARALLTIPAP